MYKLFLTLRYLRKRRIAFFAIAAVTLCVAMVLIVMSVMGGWLDQVKKRARGLLGDVIVDNSSYSGFPLYQEFIDQIKTWPEIVQATPVIYSYGILRFVNREQTSTVTLVGVRLNEVYTVNAFRQTLYYENYYPGTTTLAPQRQPLIGILPDAEPWVLKSGRKIMPIGLPSPFAEKLAEVRKAYQQRTGQPFSDPDKGDAEMEEILRETGQPPIPGVFAWNMSPNPEDPTREMTGPPLMGGNELPGLIIGRDLCAWRESDGSYDRRYALGRMVDLTVLPVSTEGNPNQKPDKVRFRYADDSRTGIYEIDSKHVYADFEYVQKILEMGEAEKADGPGKIPARCSQIQIKTKPGVDGKALCVKLDETFHQMAGDAKYELDPEYRQLVVTTKSLTWEETQAHIIVPVEKERMLVTILFGIISLVAVALVLCILYMIVLQKTRDIGIVKAIGGSSGGVALIFVLYGAVVGIVGAALGTLGGTLFVININRIQDWLIWQFNWRVWDLKVYSFDTIPNEVSPWDAAAIIVIAISAATIGSVAAAWRAGRMQPVEAIRYE